MENTSLRASLDALASHAQTLERKNAALQKEVEGRERMVRSIVGGVRREVGLDSVLDRCSGGTRSRESISRQRGWTRESSVPISPGDKVVRPEPPH